MTKKQYLTPNTEMMSLGSAGIMQSLQIMTGSGAATVGNGDSID